MRILCINYEYPPVGGGGANVSRGLAEQLVKNGHEIDLVTSAMKGLKEYEEVNGVSIHRTKCVRRFLHYTTPFELATGLIPAYKKARDLISRHKYALNHTHFVLPSGIISYLLWNKTKLPYVITIHGSDVPGYNPDRFKLAHTLLHPVWRRVIAGSARVICPSMYIRDLVHRYIDVPITVIPNGYNVNAPSGVEKKNRILLVTRMFERKGIQYFLKAIQDLDTDWEIMVVGDGPYLPKLKQLAESVKPDVIFPGFIQGDALDELYNTSKIYVFPSINENFPTVLLEAMNAGCAIITTNAAGCAEVVGDAGIRTDPGDVSQIGDALSRLMNNDEDILEYSKRSRQRVQQFSWTNISNRYSEIYNSI